MTKAATLKVISNGAPPEPPGEAPLSQARARLRDAISLRSGLEAEQVAIDASIARLRSLYAAEQKASAAVSQLEASATQKTLAWARGEEAAAPLLGDGADLAQARDVMAQAQAQAAAARSAEPQLAAEMDRVLARRAELENDIRNLALSVMHEHAEAISATIAELERKAAVECAKLSAMKRALGRLAGPSGMRAVAAAIDRLVNLRPLDEPSVLAFDANWNRLADRLLADATATATLET